MDYDIQSIGVIVREAAIREHQIKDAEMKSNEFWILRYLQEQVSFLSLPLFLSLFLYRKVFAYECVCVGLYVCMSVCLYVEGVYACALMD